MIRLYILLFVLLITGGVGYGIYSYYVHTQNQLNILRENNVKLETAVKTQEESIKIMKETAEAQAKLSKELQDKLQKSEQYKDSLAEKLRKHDLTRLSLKEPAKIEERINNATKKIFRDIESDTAK